VIDVRIVKAGSGEEESFIKEVSMEVMHDVFGLYLSEVEIERFKKKGVVCLNKDYYEGRLKEGFEIMGCLEMINIMVRKP
ncbi:DUF5365 family protein, partial [Bacillus subtilis]|uniref:DUF5365 family protein n=1 Tax=Bacillus subtilis TaxID=1423 RepID=UPI0033073957